MINSTELFKKVFGVRSFAILSLCLFLVCLFYNYKFPPIISNYESYLNGSALNATVPNDLEFKEVDNNSAESFQGKIFVINKGYQDFIFGTFTEMGDKFTGTIKSGKFQITTDFLYIPITGYPAKTGNELLLIIEDNGQIVEKIRFSDQSPGEKLEFWKINSQQFKDKLGYFELSDQLTDGGGWLGIGKPLLTSENIDPATLIGRIKQTSILPNYSYFYFISAAIFSIIFLPGFAIKEFKPESIFSKIVFLPLPGFGLLVFYGFFLWIFRLTPVFFVGKIFLVGMIGLSLFILFKRRQNEVKVSTFAFSLSFFFYIALCLFGLQYLSVPIEIAQEIGGGRNTRSGMVASPPDHQIPYRTAAYFFHKKKRNQQRTEYFGEDWSVVSRGPITAFAINAAFNIFKIRPSDPPMEAELSFPADSEGMFLARVIGILSNAFVVLSVGYFLLGIGANKRLNLVIALVWLSLSPVVIINTTFLWSKLLAAYFIILALGDIFTNRGYKRIGFWLALAYLSHPVGGLFAPCTILFWAYLQNKGTNSFDFKNYLKSNIQLTLATIFWTLPWLIYKLILRQSDVFFKYPFGDGRGFLFAESFSSWFACRWYNFIYTLIPTAFFFSNNMKSWLWGELNEPLRWTIQYAKTLPAGIGFSLFIFAYLIAFRPNKENLSFRLFILAGNTILMLFFWGYSYDGLGRNCLEPLAIILIIYASSQTDKFINLFKVGLALLFAESIYLVFSGFIFNPSFRFETLSNSNYIQFSLLFFNLLVILLMGLWTLNGNKLDNESLLPEDLY